ncbi:37S ribosomal protein Mrp10, mitochondrial [Aspergillus heterothallicus]
MPVKPPPSTRLTPVRLNSINHLRVRRPNTQENNPCAVVLSSMLSCWASSGHGAESCQGLEKELKACMDVKRPKTTERNTVNFHLARMYPKVVGPKKKKGVLG